MYSFDIHCNAAYAFCFFTVFVQLILSFIVLRDGLFARFVANSIYLVGFLYYCYITFLGYDSIYILLVLPHVQKAQVFLFPVTPSLSLYAISLLEVNLSQLMVNYFYAFK